MIVNDSNLGAKTSQKEPEEYHCKKCDYTTCKIGNWKRHLKTKKHNATEDDDSDSDYDPDEEEEGDDEYNDEEPFNLAEYIRGFGEPADERQHKQWEFEVQKAMRSLPPKTLYTNLLQMNEQQRATLFALLSPEEQQIQNQLDAQHKQEQAMQHQMLTDEDLMEVANRFNEAYQAGNSQEALRVLSMLAPIQIVQLRKLYRTRGALNMLDEAVKALPPEVIQSVAALTDPQEMSGGAANPVNILYESTD